jgi:hypothetical protein
MTPITIPVSAGELIDKITILEIKSARFPDGEKRRLVCQELALLEAVRDQAIAPTSELADLSRQLKAVNDEIWRVEDALRLCERNQDFGTQFVQLARSVYRNNDLRADLKRRVNECLGSSLTEQKLYPRYE